MTKARKTEKYLSCTISEGIFKMTLQYLFVAVLLSFSYFADGQVPSAPVNHHRETHPSGPMPYQFGYDVSDEYEGRQYRHEEKDLDGVVKGQYGYLNPYGVFRHVIYLADKYGFRTRIVSNEPGLGTSNPADVKIERAPHAPPRAVLHHLPPLSKKIKLTSKQTEPLFPSVQQFIPKSISPVPIRPVLKSQPKTPLLVYNNEGTTLFDGGSYPHSFDKGLKSHEYDEGTISTSSGGHKGKTSPNEAPIQPAVYYDEPLKHPEAAPRKPHLQPFIIVDENPLTNKYETGVSGPNSEHFIITEERPVRGKSKIILGSEHVDGKLPVNLPILQVEQPFILEEENIKDKFRYGSQEPRIHSSTVLGEGQAEGNLKSRTPVPPFKSLAIEHHVTVNPIRPSLQQDDHRIKDGWRSNVGPESRPQVIFDELPLDESFLKGPLKNGPNAFRPLIFMKSITSGNVPAGKSLLHAHKPTPVVIPFFKEAPVGIPHQPGYLKYNQNRLHPIPHLAPVLVSIPSAKTPGGGVSTSLLSVPLNNQPRVRYFSGVARVKMAKKTYNILKSSPAKHNLPDDSVFLIKGRVRYADPSYVSESDNVVDKPNISIVPISSSAPLHDLVSLHLDKVLENFPRSLDEKQNEEYYSPVENLSIHDTPVLVLDKEVPERQYSSSIRDEPFEKGGGYEIFKGSNRGVKHSSKSLENTSNKPHEFSFKDKTNGEKKTPVYKSIRILPPDSPPLPPQIFPPPLSILPPPPGFNPSATELVEKITEKQEKKTL
ncbi:uncharacterized protein LOC143258640 [Tachypleus tridentatus]|uniref:uncharacterized protein LOC143258640 n=1 Tax=Tachypleus tridentatus TaxID=6853 RepID=UPI003FD0A680